MDSSIVKYNNKLDILKNKCLCIENDEELKDLFKGVLIMFIKNILNMSKKLNNSYNNIINKISELNILLDYLEDTNKLINIDLKDILLRAYINYFYKDYRDYIINWDIEAIKNINNDNIKNFILDTINKENINDDISEYLDIIPEISIMINNLDINDILKIFYLLNNINIIIDIYLVKKHNLK